MATPNSKLLPTIALAGVVIIWSLVPSLIRNFALETGAADSIVIRMWTNAICAIPLLLWAGAGIERQDLRALLLTSVIGNFGYYVGSIFGFANMSAGAGGMLYATGPLMIAGLAIIVGVERLSFPVILGLVISFAGTIYLFTDGLGNVGANPVFGGLMMLASGACWAVYVIYTKPLIQKYGAFRVTLWTTILCAPPALVFASGETWHTVISLSQGALFALFFLAIIGTLLSVNFWNYAAGHLSPTSVGAALYLVPPCIALFGWLLFGESTGVKTLIAGLVILTGVGVAEFGKSFRVAKA